MFSAHAFYFAFSEVAIEDIQIQHGPCVAHAKFLFSFQACYDYEFKHGRDEGGSNSKPQNSHVELLF